MIKTMILSLKYLFSQMSLLLLCFVLSLILCLDWVPVQDTVLYYLANSAFPGCVLIVANSTNVIYNKSFGTLSKADFPKMQSTTTFDIASLTKVTATLSAIMHLHSQNLIDIYDPVTKYIPQYNHKSQTLIQNLLLHNAGLLPDYPTIDIHTNTKDQIMRFIYECKLDYPIGSKFVYSDLSFIVLGEIVERITHMRLQQYTAIMMRDMGMKNTAYLGNTYRHRQGMQSVQELQNIAPTQYNTRKKLIHGVVHDPTAYIFNGVAGHAGLFSTASDLTRYMQIHLNKGVTAQGNRIFNASTVELFYRRVDGLQYPNRRALGWDTVPISDTPPCGTLFSLNSFGHTGYTGTMMWADRDKDLIVVLLTNRVHPTAKSVLISEARGKIVDAVVKTLLP